MRYICIEESAIGSISFISVLSAPRLDAFDVGMFLKHTLPKLETVPELLVCGITLGVFALYQVAFLFCVGGDGHEGRLQAAHSLSTISYYLNLP
jgi:hypothetical protein